MSFNLPLNRMANDIVTVTSGVVAFGSQNQQLPDDFLSWLEPNYAIVDVIDNDEFDLWAQLQYEILILAAGSPGAPTKWMVLDARSQLLIALKQTLLQLKHVYLLFAPPQTSEHITRQPLSPKTPTQIPLWLHETIVAAANKLPGGTDERTAVAAGLHLLYDDLDGSHSLSQTIEGRGQHQNGDYWHAIMHRREPDYGNAKYWFRRVGPHPVFAKLPAVLEHVQSSDPSESLNQWASRLVKSGLWDPFAMVDACESACGPQADPQFRRALEELQHFEMLHLLVQSCQDAGFSPPQPLRPQSEPVNSAM